MEKKHIIIIFVFIGLLATAPLLISVLPKGATGAIVDETWGIASGFTNLQVGHAGLSPENFAATNPYRIEGQYESDLFVPKIIGEMSSSIRRSAEEPRQVAGKYVHLFLFDISVRTEAYHVSLTTIYQGGKAEVRLDFGIVLQGGIFSNDTPAAHISDVWVESAETGLSAYPGQTWEEIDWVFEQGADPAANIIAEVTGVTSAGAGLVRSRPDDYSVECSVSQSMRAGGVIEWALGWFNLPYAKDLVVYNVYTQYLITFEVLVDISTNGDPDPFILNPFEIILTQIADFGVYVAGMWEAWMASLGAAAPFVAIALIIAVTLLTLFICSKVRGKGDG